MCLIIKYLQGRPDWRKPGRRASAGKPCNPQPGNSRPENSQQIPLFNTAPNLADCLPFRFYGDTMQPQWIGGEILAIKPIKTITAAALLPGCVYVVRVAGYPAALVGRLYFAETSAAEQEAAAVTIRPENTAYPPTTIPIKRITEIFRVIASISYFE